MRDAPVYGVMCRRQRLPEDLAAEHLRTADVATFAAEDVVLYSLEPEQCDQVIQDRMHATIQLLA